MKATDKHAVIKRSQVTRWARRRIRDLAFYGAGFPGEDYRRGEKDILLALIVWLRSR